MLKGCRYSMAPASSPCRTGAAAISYFAGICSSNIWHSSAVRVGGVVVWFAECIVQCTFSNARAYHLLYLIKLITYLAWFGFCLNLSSALRSAQ
jgi:hypothetical protein